MRRLAAKIARTARANGMEPCACAEPTDFGGCGVARARCVDAELLGRIGGIPLRAPRDPNQRAECGCAVSVDLGAYNTCPNGCVYCYANFSPSLLRERLARRNDASPLLCDALSEGDCVTEQEARIAARRTDCGWNGERVCARDVRSLEKLTPMGLTEAANEGMIKGNIWIRRWKL